MAPRDVIRTWVAAFNNRDPAAAAALYHDDAVNLQVATGSPVHGRAAILEDLTGFFTAFPDSTTHEENLFEDGAWAILEWSGGGTWLGPLGGHPPTGKTFTLRGCGFFQIDAGKIRYQRGYWDKLTWFKQIGLPIE